jgi:hypothetical protein
MDHNRAFASLEKKLSAAVGHRADLQFADARRINRSTAHFMLAYTDEKIPASDDIAEFFVRKYNAKITPFLSTAKVYKGQKVITVVAQVLSITRDIADVKKMCPVIEGAVYLDVPLQETWEIAQKEGKKVLVRKVKDDVMALVAARKKTMMDSYSNTTFASLVKGDSITRFLNVIDKGDFVRVLVEDKVVDAEVMNVNEAEVKVKYSGGQVSVPRHNVLEVTAKSPSMIEKQEKEMTDYFAKAYGDEEYAEDLVK